MGNKSFTEADRKATPAPQPLPGFTLPTGGRGQRVSLERGVATRSKKNPGAFAGAPEAQSRPVQQAPGRGPTVPDFNFGNITAGR